MYRAILADPPWTFEPWSEKGTGRGAVAHYRVSSFKELAAMDVAQYAAKDCVLFLWATDPLLPLAFRLIEAWGFRYSTVAFNWVKAAKHADLESLTANTTRSFPFGGGYWTRANPEVCLLATRGKPKRTHADVHQLIIAPRREHSRKPDEIYGRIERLVPGPYLELFARSTRAGWDAALSDQLGLFDQGPVRTRNRPSNLARLHA
jgi:N6-adenosine-specific RNA methylase IME4